MPIRVLIAGAAAMLLAVVPRPAEAQTWTEITSPHFTVLSNAGESRARAVAWQFEQIHLVLARLWPWATTEFDRPVIVYAAKDEASMRGLVPEYWETRGGVRPGSVLVSAPDAHYIALRTDIELDPRDDGNVNPYRSSYWSYTGLVLTATFNRELPPWFMRGMAELFSNTIVRGNDILIGPVIPWHMQLLRDRPAVPLDVQLMVARDSPYLTKDDQVGLFDASAWALLHYLSLGDQGRNLPAFNRFAAAILKGVNPADALAATYGDLGAVDDNFRRYVKEFSFAYYRAGIDATVDRRGFPARELPIGASAVARAHLHAAMTRPVEARAELAAARKTGQAVEGPAAEVEAMLLDHEGQRDEALRAYRVASAAGTANFFSEYRLAILAWPSAGAPASSDDFSRIETSLRRSVERNPRFAPAQSSLAMALVQLRRAADGLPFAERAIALDPSASTHRLALSRVLWELSRRDEARAAALAARAIAASEPERAAAQQVLDMFQRALDTTANATARRPDAASAAAPRPEAPPAAAGPVDISQLNAACQKRDGAACAQLSALATPACEGGVLAACGLVAWIAHQGLGVAKDTARALTLYQRACDGGDAQSCIGAAQLYATGDGVTPDRARAKALLDKGCAGGSAQACDIARKMP